MEADIAETQCGRTPLLWAAEGGYEGVMKLPLESENISPNTVDTIYVKLHSRVLLRHHVAVGLL